MGNRSSLRGDARRARRTAEALPIQAPSAHPEAAPSMHASIRLSTASTLESSTAPHELDLELGDNRRARILHISPRTAGVVADGLHALVDEGRPGSELNVRLPGCSLCFSRRAGGVHVSASEGVGPCDHWDVSMLDVAELVMELTVAAALGQHH